VIGIELVYPECLNSGTSLRGAQYRCLVIVASF